MNEGSLKCFSGKQMTAHLGYLLQLNKDGPTESYSACGDYLHPEIKRPIYDKLRLKINTWIGK